MRSASSATTAPPTIVVFGLPCLCLALLLTGCDELEFEGFLSKSMRIEVFQDIPITHLGMDNDPPVPVAVDTASPLLIVDQGPRGSYEDRDLHLLEALECTMDCHCNAAKPVCDSGTGDCTRDCTGDAQCKDPTRPKCDVTLGRCLPGDGIECKVSADCKAPTRPTCLGGRCIAVEQTCQAMKLNPTRMKCKGDQCAVYNPRFVFHDLEVHHFEVKPVGRDSTTPLGGLLGVPLLMHFTVRLDYRNRTLTLLDGIPDTKEDLADDCLHPALATWSTAKTQHCTAVMDTPRLGGGRIRFMQNSSEEVVELPPTRLAVPLCLLSAPFNPDEVKRGSSPEEAKHLAAKTTGVPAHAVLATGLGLSMITQTALDRLLFWDPTLKKDILKAKATLYLPSGKHEVTVVTLPRTAMVSDETRWLGPCGELALRRRLIVGGKIGISKADETMLADKTFNAASAAILSTGVEFAVVPDSNSLIQGLRNELRPATPDIDVVLGGSFLKHFVMEIDYPGERTILRCADKSNPERCQVLPFCAHPDNSDQTKILCPLEIQEPK